ncbi:MAG: phosphoglycerate kinase [Verrucomicrobiota bacterium]|nr:phosphoglycerate kinase [Verrucomicrobiota bacterium]
MNKKTIRDLNLRGKRVLMRVDFNVPVENGMVSDDTRIVAALPSIRYALDNGASVVLMSHLGRPKGDKAEPRFSLKPVVARLGELLGRPVQFATDCVGADAEAKARALKTGEALLLENLRFHREEEGKANVPENASAEEIEAAKAEMKKKQEAFARRLAKLGDVYVNDAFGTAHRAHASVSVVTRFCEENAAGFLMEKELDYLGRAVADPERPFLAIMGGAKVSDKIEVITHLLSRVDVLLIGGAMAYTFYRAKGLPTGKSLVEEDKIDLAGRILDRAKEKKVKLFLPVDHVVGDQFDAGAKTKVVGESEIPADWLALDIGPKTVALYEAEVGKAKTVVWNGPMGCFEMSPFARGTFAMAQALAKAKCVSIIGGGDSASAVNKSGLAEKMTHISTGGGASLEFLEGKALPGVTALSDRQPAVFRR